MKRLIKRIMSMFYTKMALKNVKSFGGGGGVKCNFRCKFTSNAELGFNCHFNGMKISGNGHVIIGDNFHSGKNIRILTTFHNYDKGEALPYDDTTYSKDVIIEDNVWIGESVLILGVEKGL